MCCVLLQPRAWTLVFRITPDLGIGAADSWYQNEPINDGDDSLRTTESTPAGIYKSSLATPSGWHGVAMVSSPTEYSFPGNCHVLLLEASCSLRLFNHQHQMYRQIQEYLMMS